MADRLLVCKHNDGLGHCEVFGGEYCVESPCQHEELVEYAPVVHGEWVEREHRTYDSVWGEDVIWYTYKCSNPKCGEEAMSDFPYCPFCGAKMDGERKGDE